VRKGKTMKDNKFRENFGQNIHTDIIIENIEKLSNIFKKANKEICPNCSYNSIKPPKDVGCCRWCGEMGGFFDKIEYHVTFLYFEKMRQEFSFDEKEFGFFNNSTKQCNLPREFRSHVCLAYVCEQMNFDRNQKYNIEKICEIIKMCKQKLLIPF
jgi:hypothetical protein